MRRSCCQQRRLAADGLEAGLEMRRRLRGSWGFVGARVAAGEGLGALGAVLRLRLLVGVAAPGLAAEDARVLTVCREKRREDEEMRSKEFKNRALFVVVEVRDVFYVISFLMDINAFK